LTNEFEYSGLKILLGDLYENSVIAADFRKLLSYLTKQTLRRMIILSFFEYLYSLGLVAEIKERHIYKKQTNKQ